jgi:hypothetical protein
MIELAAAVVGDIDARYAVIQRDPGVLRGGDALDRQRNVDFLTDALDGSPIQRRLEFAARRPPAAAHHVALGEVALAPAIDRGIDGEAEPTLAVGDGTGDANRRPSRVAGHIELKHPHAVGRCCAATFSRPGSHTELSMWAMPDSRAARATAPAAPS